MDAAYILVAGLLLWLKCVGLDLQSLVSEPSLEFCMLV